MKQGESRLIPLISPEKRIVSYSGNKEAAVMGETEKRLRGSVTGGSEQNRQPKAVQDSRPGYGNKKLEGPNRPST